MSDMTMVERVARALGEADKWQRTDDAPDYRAHLPAWLDYEADARAAIEAMQEAPDDFFAIISIKMRTVRRETYPVLRSFLRAVVDAALSEQKP